MADGFEDPFKPKPLAHWQKKQYPPGTIIERGDRSHPGHSKYDPRAFYHVPTLLKYGDPPRAIRSDFLNVRSLKYADQSARPVVERTPSLEEMVHDPDCVDVLCPGGRCLVKGHHEKCMNVLCMGGYMCFEEIENQEKKMEADKEREFLKSLPNPFKAFTVGGWYQDPEGIHKEAKTNYLIHVVLQNYGLLNAYQIFYKLAAENETDPNPFTSVDELKEYLDLRPFIFYKGKHMRGYANTGYGFRVPFATFGWFIYNRNKRGEACRLEDLWEKVVKHECSPLDPAAIVRNMEMFTDCEFTVQHIDKTRFIEMFVEQMSSLFSFKGEGDNVSAMLKPEAMFVLPLFFSAALPYGKQFLEVSDVSRREQLVVKIENADKACADGYVLHGNFYRASVRISAFRCKLPALPSSVYVGNIVRVVAFRIFRGSYEFEGVSVAEFEPGWRQNRSTYIEDNTEIDSDNESTCLEAEDEFDDQDGMQYLTQTFPNYCHQQELLQEELEELNKLFDKEDAKRKFCDSLFDQQQYSMTRANLERRYKAFKHTNNPFSDMEDCFDFIQNRTYLYYSYHPEDVEKLGSRIRARMEECLEIISRFPEGISPNQIEYLIQTVPNFCSDDLQTDTHYGDLPKYLIEACDHCVVSDAFFSDDPDDKLFVLNGTYFVGRGFLSQKYKNIIRA